LQAAAKFNRRLAAILAADIAGYARLMGADEAATVEAIKGHQAVLLPLVGEYGGRVIDTAGDGILAEHPSVVDALGCALEIQDVMRRRNDGLPSDRRMHFRIGVNFGDVIHDDGRIYGDGIHVAARLQAVAQPGGICVSSKVRDEVVDKLDLQFLDLGEQVLKNIARKVHVFAVERSGVASPTHPAALPAAKADEAPPRIELSPSFALLGREADVAALVGHLEKDSLISVVGTGGVGKTSLAKAALSRYACPDPVYWIDLAPLRQGQFVPRLAESLGIELHPSSQNDEELVAVLSRTKALIAVDNCEHVLAEVAGLIHQALERARGIRWLATSQVPLHLAGEVVYRLHPLDVPSADATLSEALGSGAIALLRDRVAASDRHFDLTSANLATAIDLCRQLDGLPLAIEMVAARVAILGLHGVHQQIGERMRLLAGPRDGPPRHHSLRRTFEWSYELLSASERTVFRRLEPFLGGFTRSMAQRISCETGGSDDQLDEWKALEALGGLVDKSLVQRDAESPDRFFLLESARDYARDRLAEAGETWEIRRRHAQVVAEIVDTANADSARLDDVLWNALYIPERHNVRAALEWACEAREPDLLARLVAALAQIDSLNHRQAEVVQLDVPIAVLLEAQRPLRAAACLEFSWAHYSDGSRKLGTELALRALADFNEIGDTAGAYRALAQLIRLYESRLGTQEEVNKARAMFQQIDARTVPLRTRLFCSITAGSQHGRTMARLKELEEIAHRSGFEALAAACRTHITDELLIEGRFEEAVETAQRFLDAGEFRPRDRALILNNQALALVQLGRVRHAHEPSRAALRALPSAAHTIVDIFALAAAREGRFVDAGLMFGYGDKVRRERDRQSDPAEAAVIAETGAALKQALAAERLEELMQLGASMKTSDVLALAIP
jgi:predicted ATPase/class 3 adenylate cyclase